MGTHKDKTKEPVSFCTFDFGSKALVCLLLLGGLILGGLLLDTAYGRIAERTRRANLLSSGKQMTGKILKKSIESQARKGTQSGRNYSYELRVQHTSISTGQPVANSVLVSEGVYNSFEEGGPVNVYVDTNTEQAVYEFLPKEIETGSIAVGAVVGLLSWLVALFLIRFIVRSYLFGGIQDLHELDDRGVAEDDRSNRAAKADEDIDANGADTP